MSEENKNEKNEGQEIASAVEDQGLKLNGLFAFKMGMSSVYNDDGAAEVITVLKYEPWMVSQLKKEETDGYEAVQIACRPKKETRTCKAEQGHLSDAGFENGAYFVKEIRQALPEGVEVGQKVSINSFSKGDKLKMTAKSKGRGFAGGMKRWSFAGGPASHGSGFHRRPGSIGNRTWPGRVIPGKKMAGHFGDEVITVRNVTVVDVLADEGVLFVKGPVPGARNGLVKMMKEVNQ